MPVVKPLPEAYNCPFRDLFDLLLLLTFLALCLACLLVKKGGGETQLKINMFGDWEYAPSRSHNQMLSRHK